MANNRLYLYCPRCNKALMIGKHFGGTYNIRENIENISNFMSEHRWCLNQVDSLFAIGLCLAEEDGNCDTMTGLEIPSSAEIE